MGRIIKRIQESAIDQGFYRPRRSGKPFGLPSHANESAVKEERRLAEEHRAATQVETRGRRSRGLLGAFSRLFRRKQSR